MRRWTHEVSVEWLKARQSVLTATEVAGLLPEWKRWLKKGSDPETLMPGAAALWAAKHSTGEPDVNSPSPAAARGHIMEPWAVDSWNAQVVKRFWHWDDCIICRSDFAIPVGFSPDAMDIAQVYPDSRLEVTADGKFIVNSGMMSCDAPTEVMEIKSYEIPRHMKSVLMEKMEHEELMQLAMAFVVFPDLVRARLVWFCPDAPISMHAETYTSDDLHDQIRWIMEILEWYQGQRELCEKLPKPWLKAQCTEEEVWNSFVAEQACDSWDDVFMLKG